MVGSADEQLEQVWNDFLGHADPAVPDKQFQVPINPLAD
jgi:hypothetical protein